MKRMLALALAAAMALPTPAWADAVLKKLPAQLDASKAYVVIEIGKVDDGILYGTIVLSRYDAARAEIANPAPGAQAAGRLTIAAPLIKDGDRRLYLAELDPGLWVVEGVNDTAFSLGSSTLDLAAGTVTDMGVAVITSDFPEGEKRDVMTNGRVLKGALMGGIFGSKLPPPMPKAVEFRARSTGDIPLPASLAAQAQPVAWAGEVRFGNHLGGLVNRMGGRKARPGAGAAAPSAALPEQPAGN